MDLYYHRRVSNASPVDPVLPSFNSDDRDLSWLSAPSMRPSASQMSANSSLSSPHPYSNDAAHSPITPHNMGMSPATTVQHMPSPVMSQAYSQVGLEDCVSPHDVESHKYPYQLVRHPEEFQSFQSSYSSPGWDLQHLNGGGVMGHQGSFDYPPPHGFTSFEEEYNSDDSSGNNQQPQDSRRSVAASGEARDELDTIIQGPFEQPLPQAFERGLQRPQNLQYAVRASIGSHPDLEHLVVINPDKMYSCTIERCMANPFKRKTDAMRHLVTVHFPERIRFDCTVKRCGRKGTRGFTRKDHFREHMKETHGMPDEPKPAGRGRRNSAQARR